MVGQYGSSEGLQSPNYIALGEENWVVTGAEYLHGIWNRGKEQWAVVFSISMYIFSSVTGENAVLHNVIGYSAIV